ncbi:MAG: hypothetical protein HGA28_07220 [Anaerolineaceae bacterium]|nr:hypothetical protein [Anaerolineaceae bacterium]
MSANKIDELVTAQDIHAFLEKTLLEAYLNGRGYSLEALKDLPEEKAKQLMKEASIYASSKLAEVEIKAQFVKDLHDAYTND